jgi:pimeloyl-ACP methyl ester carboxylesterase
MLLTFVSLNLAFSNQAFSQTMKEHMVDVGGHKLHCRVFGQGKPAFVLVSGANVRQSYWDQVVPALAAETTVITYDRAGYGNSGIGDHDYHGVRQAKELKSMLDKIGVPGPYILVGHSFGGWFVRLFASMHPHSTAGLILEDATPEDSTEYRLRRLKGNDLRIVEAAASSPAQDRLPLGLRAEEAAREITEQQVREITSMPQVPFLVISGNKPLHRRIFSEDANRIMHEIKIELHKKSLELIPGGKHIIVEGVYHTIHAEKPEAFIKPVLELLKMARE